VGELDPSRAAVLLSFEVPDPPLIAAAEAAAAAGVPVVANPAPARALPGPLVACGPILTPNEPEAVALTGLSDPRAAARALAERTGAAVVLTLGAAGALVAEPGGGQELVPAPAVAVVDTTGAGDVFSGVLAAGLAARRGLRPAVEAAVQAASRSVTTPGAR
jgi:ribokinase